MYNSLSSHQSDIVGGVTSAEVVVCAAPVVRLPPVAGDALTVVVAFSVRANICNDHLKARILTRERTRADAQGTVNRCCVWIAAILCDQREEFTRAE